MTSLIAKVRLLIAGVGTTPAFSDEQVQDALDAHRTDHYVFDLQYSDLIAPGGVFSFTEYFADRGDWEDDVVLQDRSYNYVTTLTTPGVAAANLTVGKWTLTATLYPPLFLTGKSYDIYAAAVDLLTDYLAQNKDDFDFLAAGRTFKRHQKSTQVEALIDLYKARRRITVTEMYRSDMNVMQVANAY